VSVPFTSFAQEAFLKHNHPEIYRRWLKAYGHYKGKKKHVAEAIKRRSDG
jgi:hypothetical protein